MKVFVVVSSICCLIINVFNSIFCFLVESFVLRLYISGRFQIKGTTKYFLWLFYTNAKTKHYRRQIFHLTLWNLLLNKYHRLIDIIKYNLKCFIAVRGQWSEHLLLKSISHTASSYSNYLTWLIFSCSLRCVLVDLLFCDCRVGKVWGSKFN